MKNKKSALRKFRNWLSKVFVCSEDTLQVISIIDNMASALDKDLSEINEKLDRIRVIECVKNEYAYIPADMRPPPCPGPDEWVEKGL